MATFKTSNALNTMVPHNNEPHRESNLKDLFSEPLIGRNINDHDDHLIHATFFYFIKLKKIHTNIPIQNTKTGNMHRKNYKYCFCIPPNRNIYITSFTYIHTIYASADTKLIYSPQIIERFMKNLKPNLFLYRTLNGSCSSLSIGLFQTSRVNRVFISRFLDFFDFV